MTARPGWLSPADSAREGSALSGRPWRIAIVGSGPRGLMVLERLAARIGQNSGERPVELCLIDEVEVGCGRIFRTDQPPWFLMNTSPGQITLFSGPPDDGPARAGAGPSLAQWWSTVDPESYPGPDGYAPRALYGRYLRFTLEAIDQGLPRHARLQCMHTTVLDLQPTPNGYLLPLADGGSVDADSVVLATGHARPPSRPHRFADFVARHPDLLYIEGDSPADMPLDAVPVGVAVGVLGLGLSFYDVMAALTLGRGGRFIEGPHAELVYRPSGKEPVILAGSRSALPPRAKAVGRGQTGPAYRPMVFTDERVRRRAPRAVLNFTADVLPWLMAELELVYYATALRRARGERAAQAFVDEVVDPCDIDPTQIRAVAGRHGVGDLPVIDLERLTHPFARRAFASPEEFDHELTGLLGESVDDAERGGAESPLMAAIDVIRETRGTMRLLVDFGGLDPASHRDDFLGSYAPNVSMLAAGPPPVRVRQALALMNSGLLRVVGPEARIDTDSEVGRFTVSSPHVAGAQTAVTCVIDARVPPPDITGDPSALTARLLARGLWTEFVNRGNGGAFRTGGVAVTTAPFHPVGRDGRPDTGLYVLGVPSEHTRWFTQVGSARPGAWGDFVRDADAIAGHALRGVFPGRQPSAMAGAVADGRTKSEEGLAP